MSIVAPRLKLYMLVEEAKAKGDPSGLIQWFNDGADGQISWGDPGDFDDCVALAADHMDEDQARGFCNLRHQDAVGGPPGSEDKKVYAVDPFGSPVLLKSNPEGINQYTSGGGSGLKESLDHRSAAADHFKRFAEAIGRAGKAKPGSPEHHQAVTEAIQHAGHYGQHAYAAAHAAGHGPEGEDATIHAMYDIASRESVRKSAKGRRA